MPVSILGAETANFVLKVFATGGVHFGGGVALHLINILTEPRFVHAFSNKGPFKELMSRIPVPVVTARAALAGAATYGFEPLERHKGTA
jgi:glucokinase